MVPKEGQRQCRSELGERRERRKGELAQCPAWPREAFSLVPVGFRQTEAVNRKAWHVAVDLPPASALHQHARPLPEGRHQGTTHSLLTKGGHVAGKRVWFPHCILSTGATAENRHLVTVMNCP